MKRQTNRILLNVGCGKQRPANWINTDCSINAQLQRIALLRWLLVKCLGKTEYAKSNVRFMNLNRAWPFQTASVDVVYGSHVFEHLNRTAARLFLEESRRVLRQDGVIRLAVPDLHALCENYIKNFQTGDSSAANKLLTVVNMHQDGAYGNKHSLVERWLHAWQGYPHQHKYMYDQLSLAILLEEVGFRRISAKCYADSELIPEIREVEATAEGVAAIYLEAMR